MQVVSDYNPPINFSSRSLDETHHMVQNRTVAIRRYDPPLNFRARLLDKTYHVVHRTVAIRRCPSSDVIDEKKTRKEVTFSGF